MTAAGEVMLERWYRRLLRAYPAGYRRSHGEEILTTLMDSADPGRRVPARADVLDLMRGALRQWFRLPVGRSAVVAAVLAALVLGALGAGAGSWLAWQTAEEPPSATAAVQVTETVAGTSRTAPDIVRRDGWREASREVHVANLQVADWSLEAAQARARADGWSLGPVDEYIVATYPFGKLSPLPGVARTGPDEVYQMFQATKDGLVLRVHAGPVAAPGSAGTSLQAVVHPDSPGWEPAAILLGWLAGAAAGWILTAWAGYRLRRRALLVRAGAVVLGLAALWSAVDLVPGLYRTLAGLAFTEPGVERIPPAYDSIMSNPEQVGATVVIGLAILALAATSRRRPTLTAA